RMKRMRVIDMPVIRIEETSSAGHQVSVPGQGVQAQRRLDASDVRCGRARDDVRNPCRVASDAMNHLGRERIQKVQANEVQAWLLDDHAAFMSWLAGGVENGRVE